MSRAARACENKATAPVARDNAKTPTQATPRRDPAALSAPLAGRNAIDDRAFGPGWSLSAMRVFPPPHQQPSGKDLRETASATPLAVPNAIGAVQHSAGRPLDTAARRMIEPRFGHDFRHVRVHADTSAAQSAKAVAATAYTVGHNIAFDAGEYYPSSHQGRALLAHELAPTIQQDRAKNASAPLALVKPSDQSEQEADRAAAAVLNGGPIAVNQHRVPSLQRQPNPLPATPHSDLGEGLAENASPFMAAAIRSVTIDRFVTGKSDVSAKNAAQLARTAAITGTLLVKYPGSTVRVIGHADAIGKESDNQTLGQARADAVHTALTGLGIPPGLIATESKGETQLLVKTDRAEPRNRRVEVRFEPQTLLSNALPAPTLTPPGAPPQEKPVTPDLRLPPTYQLDTPRPPFAPKDPTLSLPPNFWKPLPPGPKSTGSSADDKLNDLTGKITSFLLKSVCDTARGLVKDAIEKGIISGLDSALQSAGVDSGGRQAVGKAVEAALKQRIGGTP
jgi:outer membrane protein OmpA-like peptidoglycan-associated protein